MYRSPVWFAERCLPDGRHRPEGYPAGVLRDESLHRLDTPHGGQSGLAVVRGPLPAGTRGGARDHRLARLHPRDHQAKHEGRLWLLPAGELCWI